MGRQDSCIKCCPLFCLKCIIIGWIGFPIHCLRCCFTLNPDRNTLYDNRPCNGMFDSETLCLPMKRHCNANGRNKRFKLYFPFGFLEAVSLVTSFFLLLKVFQLMSFPFAYVDTATIQGKKILFNTANMTTFTAPYEAWRQRNLIKNKTYYWKTHMAGAFTMLDEDMVNNWPNPGTYNKDSMVESFDKLIVGNNKTTYSDFNNLIILSHQCFCKGFYPASGLLSKKECQAFAKEGYCKMSNGAALTFIDIPKPVKGALAQAAGPVMKYFALTGFVMSFFRLFYYWWNPRQLQMPGSQWICGFWTFLFILVCGVQSNGMINQLNIGKTLKPPRAGFLGLYFVPTLGPFGAKKGGAFWALNAGGKSPLITHLGQMKKLAQLTWFSNFLIQFLSEYSYCADCSHFSMLNDNLILIKRNHDKKLARKNSVVFGTQNM